MASTPVRAMTPQLMRGLEAGTIEAAQQFQKNKFQNIAARQLSEAEAQTELLTEIRDNTIGAKDQEETEAV